MKPTLIVMAAGIGSRFGGCKQIEPVGPSGELIIDYSVYDALKAGFGKFIFVISKEIEKDFKEVIGDRISGFVPIEYAYQRPDDLPDGYRMPAGRTKPWGTGHAVYCCRNMIDRPYAVINADDFYGSDAFFKAEAHLGGLSAGGGNDDCCMVGYYIENTLTEYGYVARGICGVTPDGCLADIKERTHIEYKDGKIVYTDDGVNFTAIEPGTVVSMNLWGFPAAVMRSFEPSFERFLSRDGADLLKDEFFLPTVVDEIINRESVRVKVLSTTSQWYGVTYREDLEHVKKAVSDMISNGVYPYKLW